ncbi:MAG TPA: ATP-grasp domain-containing protein [Clostridiales bacterium]|nr:ATP-grasp domain-containing protein [Clostridiales bacterium]
MDAINQLKEMGCETYACAMEKDGPGADAADHFDIINILDIESIKEHISKNKIDLVYSVGSDLAMPVACKISEEMSLPRFVSAQTAIVCNNKEKMRTVLGEDCTGNVPFLVMENVDDEPRIPMPFIMKPSDSQGQRGIFLVNTMEDFTQNFETAKRYSRSGKVIIEKYISGPELSVNAYLVDGQVLFIEASDRVTWPQYTGLIHKHVVPAVTISDKVLGILGKVVEDACNRVGITNGPAYFQIKVENDKPYIIEMTPRLDGCHMWKLLSYYTGVNLLKLTFEHLLYNNTSELANMQKDPAGYELEFFCQEPNTMMNQSIFRVPEDSLTYFYYYNTGEMIRPVNNKYEKVGYYIRRLGE